MLKSTVTQLEMSRALPIRDRADFSLRTDFRYTSLARCTHGLSRSQRRHYPWNVPPCPKRHLKDADYCDATAFLQFPQVRAVDHSHATCNRRSGNRPPHSQGKQPHLETRVIREPCFETWAATRPRYCTFLMKRASEPEGHGKAVREDQLPHPMKHELQI
ncbi:hypothetical protein NX059_007194 [Plenodomus lindquistii]|nr:hypothetical protein NX059_007194 [Plenodomus lindquistii]